MPPKSDKDRLREIGTTYRNYQNPNTTNSAGQVFDADDINQRTKEEYYAEEVAEENRRRALRYRGIEIHSG